MAWNIFKKKSNEQDAQQPAAAAKKETIEQRIERELNSLPGPLKKQMDNPQVKARFIEIAKRMEADGVDFQSIKQMKKWIKAHEKELKEEQQNGPKIVTVVKSDAEQTGRNEPCPCGSGKKYKKCCGLS